MALVITKLDARIAFMTIDNSPQNMINIDVLNALKTELEAIQGNTFIRAVILDSANGTPPFSADGAALLAARSPEAQRAELVKGQTTLTWIENFNKPIIMAIYNGMMLGGGLELAWSCHMRVAGDQCVFNIPEAVAGAMPGWGNTSRLIRLFGRERAIEMVLTGFSFTAEQMERWGDVNYVVPGDQVLAKATELAEKVAYMRTKSIEAILDTFNFYSDVQAGKDRELANYMDIHDPDTFQMAIEALFAQKNVDFID